MLEGMEEPEGKRKQKDQNKKKTCALTTGTLTKKELLHILNKSIKFHLFHYAKLLNWEV
jgi:hypothetical protein